MSATRQSGNPVRKIHLPIKEIRAEIKKLQQQRCVIQRKVRDLEYDLEDIEKEIVRKRDFLSYQVAKAVAEDYRIGISITDLCRMYNLSTSSVRYILAGMDPDTIAKKKKHARLVKYRKTKIQKIAKKRKDEKASET